MRQDPIACPRLDHPIMGLLDLPCEILLSIAEQCDDPRDILSFACVTRATYNILWELIYRFYAQQENCIYIMPQSTTVVILQRPS